MNLILNVLIAALSMVSLKNRPDPRRGSIGATASIMTFRILLGIVTVAAVIISIEHLATTLTRIFDHYDNGLYFALATFSVGPIAAIAALYLLFHRAPPPAPPAKAPHLAVTFFDGFTEGLAAIAPKLKT